MDYKGKVGSKESDKALEYYKLYSDNNKLPKYFCGTYDDKAHSSTPYKCSPVDIPMIHIEDHSIVEVDDDKVRNPSPTSSITSNRKLEWDNGADIGYENIANKSLLHKSLSLPILTSNERQLNVSSESKDSSNSEGIGQTKLSTSKKQTKNASSSEDNRKSTSSQTSCKKEILNFIKAKVGLPMAHSTPFNKLEIAKTICFEIKSQTSSNSSEDKLDLNKTKFDSSSESDVIEVKDRSSSDSTEVKHDSNERKYESSTDSSDIAFRMEGSTKVIETSSSSESKHELKIESEEKSSSSEELISTKLMENKEELYTPKKSKEDNIDNLKVKCIRGGKENEKIVAEKQSKLSPTSFFFEIKAPITDTNYDAAISNSTSQGISLHPSSSSKFESATSAPEKSNEKECKMNIQKIQVDTPASSDDKSKVCSVGNSTSTTNETVRKWNSQLDLTLPQRMKYFNRYRDNKIKNLGLTKPVYVECLGSSESKDKNIQTSSANISIGIQTEYDIIVPREAETKQQSVLYMFHPQNDSCNTNSTTQTDSDVVFSNCNSFEFLNGPECNKQSAKSSGSETGKSDKAVTDYHSKHLKRSAVKTDLTNLSSNTEHSSSSKENYLSDLLSQQLTVDIDKKLELLQKLYKSKKYDKETKKYYVRKILKSILINYSDDSSLYSEKITPNIAPNIPLQDRMIFNEGDNSSSDNKRRYEESNKQYIADSSREKQLKGNVPWVPIAPQNSSETKSVISDQSKSTKQRSQKFTLPSYHRNSTSECSSGNILKTSSDGSDGQNPNWKENKTLSERILEMRNRKLCHGDSLDSPNQELLYFAKRERENQIHWINNEIEHLAKLKKLLETKETEKKDVPGKQSTAAIYMITAERPKKGTNDIPIKSSIIRNSDISQTKFVVQNSRGTTAYKVHELQTQGSSSAYKVVKQDQENENVDKIADDLEKPMDKMNKQGSVRKCRCRSQSPHRNQNPRPESGTKPASPVKSKEFHVWRRSCKAVDSNVSQENSSHQSFVPSAKVISCSVDSKVNFNNAVLISNTVRPSLTNPGDSVRRLVLEIPLDSKMEQTQVENKGVDSKAVQTSKTLLDNTRESTSSESSISSSTCTNSSTVLCSCCRKLIAASESSLAINSDLYNNISPPPVFCQPCYHESKKKSWNPGNPYYAQPQHQCKCHTNMNNSNNNNNLDPESINKIRTTLKELEELEEREKYCQCINKKLSRHSDNMCMMCNCKIKNQKSSKKPVAYLLTFEPGEFPSPKNTQKIKSLEEIRIKVPGSKSRKKRAEDDRKHDDKKHKNSKHKIKKSLQEYLETNHPTFVKAAEERRKCMIDLAYMREQRCQKYKQLLALTNGIPMQKPCYSDIHYKRIFTSKEMKNMTTKKYKMLPEVQQKLVETRNKQIKKANRLLADIFNKKLRERVLLGNPNISASTSVINLA